jgi:hypothetical protein
MALSETKHAGGFIFSEANGHRSRENVTVASGQDLQAGAVLGKLTSSGEYIAFNNDGNTGEETVAGILIGACDATSAAKEAAIIARDAEVLGEELVWAGTEDAGDIAAGIVELTAIGIIVR